MADSPTTRTLKLLRSRGYLAAVVEKWNPHARIRQDLFGIIDVIGIREGETIAVQSTSASNQSKRIAKIEESEALTAIRSAGWTLLVHGWRKKPNGRWVCNETDLS